MIGFFRTRGVAAAAVTFFAFFAVPASAAQSASMPAAAQPAAAPATPVVPAAPSQIEAPSALQPASAQSVAASAPAALQPVKPVLAPQRPRALKDLVISFVDYGGRSAEQECLVKAIYFEARSESLEGQLAVAEVILNRAASGIYPPTICGVVTQPAQFSFIRAGMFPTPDRNSDSWRRALAIADIAQKRLADSVPPNVLWYHATYVAPSWGRRLTRVAQIGTHIFYS